MGPKQVNFRVTHMVLLDKSRSVFIKQKLSAVFIAAAVLTFAAVAAATTPSDSTGASGGDDAVQTQTQQAPIKRLVFEEQKIEGKIRRPQLVLIKADQRPDFYPMVLQSLGKTKTIAGMADRDLISRSPYRGAFQFDGTKIINIVP